MINRFHSWWEGGNPHIHHFLKPSSLIQGGPSNNLVNTEPHRVFKQRLWEDLQYLWLLHPCPALLSVSTTLHISLTRCSSFGPKVPKPKPKSLKIKRIININISVGSLCLLPKALVHSVLLLSLNYSQEIAEGRSHGRRKKRDREETEVKDWCSERAKCMAAYLLSCQRNSPAPQISIPTSFLRFQNAII